MTDRSFRWLVLRNNKSLNWKFRLGTRNTPSPEGYTYYMSKETREEAINYALKVEQDEAELWEKQKLNPETQHLYD